LNNYFGALRLTPNAPYVTVHSPLSGTAFRSTWSQPCVRL